MKTLQASQVTDADRPFLLAVGHADGTVTLYYEGDELPALPVVPETPTRYISAADYRARFTDAELAAIVSSTDAGVKLLLLKVSTCPPEGVDLLSPTVAGGLAYLVSEGILTADRTAQIVA